MKPAPIPGVSTRRPAGTVVLKPGREKSLRLRHPWIFSGGIDRIDGAPAAGATVDVRDANGAFLARAAYSPSSQIRARVWTFDEREAVDAVDRAGEDPRMPQPQRLFAPGPERDCRHRAARRHGRRHSRVISATPRTRCGSPRPACG